MKECLKGFGRNPGPRVWRRGYKKPGYKKPMTQASGSHEPGSETHVLLTAAYPFFIRVPDPEREPQMQIYSPVSHCLCVVKVSPPLCPEPNLISPRNHWKELHMKKVVSTCLHEPWLSVPLTSSSLIHLLPSPSHRASSVPSTVFRQP